MIDMSQIIALMSPEISPTFAGSRWFFGIVVFFQLSVLMQSTMALWEESMLLIEKKRQWNAPITCDRVMTVLLMLTIILLIGPLTVQNMIRAEIDPHTSHILARVVNISAAASAIPLLAAGLIKSLSRYVITIQLEKEPFAVDPHVRWLRVRKNCQVIVIVAVLACVAALR